MRYPAAVAVEEGTRRGLWGRGRSPLGGRLGSSDGLAIRVRLGTLVRRMQTGYIGSVDFATGTPILEKEGCHLRSAGRQSGLLARVEEGEDGSGSVGVATGWPVSGPRGWPPQRRATPGWVPQLPSGGRRCASAAFGRPIPGMEGLSPPRWATPGEDLWNAHATAGTPTLGTKGRHLPMRAAPDRYPRAWRMTERLP